MNGGEVRDDALRDLAAVVDRVAGAGVARARALRDAEREFDPAMWKQFSELGWLSLAVPAELDGADAGERAVTVVAEHLGAGAFPEPFVASGVLVTGVLVPLASSPPARRFLGRVITGEVLATLAWQSKTGATAGTGLPVLQDSNLDERVLDGQAWWVPVPGADTFLVHAASAQGEVLVEVPRAHPGVHVERLPLADGGALAHVDLQHVGLPAEAVLGHGPAVAAAVRSGLDAALVATAAELVGVTDRALQMTCEYLRTREQFGRPIGSFQVVAHRAVDMWIQLRLARAALDGALEVRERPAATEAERSAAASSAKARASAAAMWVCRQAVHLHGALGFSDEYDLGHYVNRALVLAAWLGAAAEHQLRYSVLTRRPESLGDPALAENA